MDFDDGDAGGAGGGEAGGGVFVDEGAVGGEAEVGEDLLVDLGVGLAVGYAFAGEDEVEVVDGADVEEGGAEVAFAGR